MLYPLSYGGRSHRVAVSLAVGDEFGIWPAGGVNGAEQVITAIESQELKSMSDMTIPIVLDVDTGTDDALAILYAVSHPDLDVLAISCVAGNSGWIRS